MSFIAAGRLAADADNAATFTFLENRVKDDPDDVTAVNRLSGMCVQRFRDTGRYEELEHAARLAAQSLKAVAVEQNTGGLNAQARVDMEYHRFAATRDEAQALVKALPKPASAYLLLGDALLELGQPEEALKKWQEAARASYAAALDAVAKADRPQPRVALWLHVQRGQMAFVGGDWDAAEADYQAAAQIVPDNFSVLDHLGELRAAQKRYPEAVALYEKVVASTGQRPEFMQSLGDVQAAAGNAAEAKRWHDLALAGYLASVEAGNGHYYHHLAGYYCDIEPNAAAALQWARKDFELRQSVYAYDALGWALYANGDWKGAADAAEKSLALNTPDPHLIFHAGMIFSRAGDPKRAGDLLRRVAEVNPKYYTSFHVHR